VPLLLVEKNVGDNNNVKPDILGENFYVFVYNKHSSPSHVWGSDCLRKFSVDCGAKHPETL